MKHIFTIVFLLGMGSVFSQSPPLLSTRTGQVKFFSSTPAEEITAVNNEVSSKFSPANGQLVFTVLIKGFRFPNALMQEHFNENYMESGKFPKASFMGTIQNMSQIDCKKEGAYPATVQGTVIIHGVTQTVTATGTVEVRGGKVSVAGTFPIVLKDYQIKGMAIGNQVATQVKVSLYCRYD